MNKIPSIAITLESKDFFVVVIKFLIIITSHYNQRWRRKWQPTPVFLPGEFHGQRSLACYSLWGRKEPDMTEGSLNLPMHSCQRRQWHPTPVLLPGKPHGWRTLVGCSPRGRKVGHDWVTSLSLFTFMHWRRKWQPTPVFLPGESQGWGSLVGCHLWGRTESDTTEAT